jgi:hypothetical protein
MGSEMKKILCYLILCIFSQMQLSDLRSQTATDAAATGISRSFNPAISVNVLFSGMASEKNNTNTLWAESGASPGMHLQTADVEITANVDVYLQSKVVFDGDERGHISVEEAYLTSLRLPIPVILRGGKMLNSFGRYNLYHIHHMAFAENPLILNYVFQPKLNEIGLEASYLLPLSWYSDLLVGFLNGNNEVLFNNPNQNTFAYLVHLDNFWDLSDETTFRLGTSYLAGPKGLQQMPLAPFDRTENNISSLVWGLDIHLKWKPLQRGRYHSFVLEGEYVNATLSSDRLRTKPLQGYYLQGLYQFGLNWWVQARYEWFERSKDLYHFFPEPPEIGVNINEDFTGKRMSVALAYVPTEFSAYRLQYNLIKYTEKNDQQIILQVNVTIGSHPAHKY